MARNALSHEPLLGGQALRIFHLPVTLPAGNLAVDMTLMIKQHMFCDIIYFDPGGRCLGVEVTMFHFNPRVICDDVIMAVQAFFHRRNPRVVGITHIGVTVLALYLFDAGVHIVAERNRLFRTETGGRCSIKQINKGSREYYGQKRQNNGDCIFFQRPISLLKEQL